MGFMTQIVEIMDPVFYVSGMDAVEEGLVLETPMLTGQEHILRYYSQVWCGGGDGRTLHTIHCCGDASGHFTSCR